MTAQQAQLARIAAMPYDMPYGAQIWNAVIAFARTRYPQIHQYLAPDVANLYARLAAAHAPTHAGSPTTLVYQRLAFLRAAEAAVPASRQVGLSNYFAD